MSSSRRLFALSFLLFAPLSAVCLGGAQSSSFYVGQFGHGASAGSFFSTEIVLINLSQTNSAATIETFDSDGNPVDLLLNPDTMASVSSLNVQVVGVGTASIRSLNPNPNQLSTAWVRISTADAIGVWVTFRIETGNQLTTAASIRVGPLVTAASMIARLGNGVRTGVSLLSPPTGAQGTVISLELVGSDGTSQGVEEVTLQPGHRMAMFIDEIFDNLDAFEGSVEIRSKDFVPVAILPLFQEGVVLTTSTLFPPRQLP